MLTVFLSVVRPSAWVSVAAGEWNAVDEEVTATRLPAGPQVKAVVLSGLLSSAPQSHVSCRHSPQMFMFPTRLCPPVPFLQKA